MIYWAQLYLDQWDTRNVDLCSRCARETPLCAVYYILYFRGWVTVMMGIHKYRANLKM
jgi:hypothetical protein